MKNSKLIRKFLLNLLVIFPATLLLLFLVVNASGSSGTDQEVAVETPLSVSYHPDKAFNAYWYNNEAELGRYALKQARYGEVHTGEAVMIFVTEHLDPKKHIKAYNENGKDVPVLKLNHTRKFFTGLYPYSTMGSVFTPVNLTENAHTLRNNFSMQEWCGHVWSMLDLEGEGYKGTVSSYFPDEGDYKVAIDNVLMEDEVFNRLRIDPASLPEGNIRIVPSFMHLRLMHKEFKVYNAKASFREGVEVDGRPSRIYELDYVDLDRKVAIRYETDFPRRILGWEETYRSGFGPKAKELTTTATLTNTMKLDYWSRNALADSAYRAELGLMQVP